MYLNNINTMHYYELKAILVVGFLSGYLPNYEMDYGRILASIIGTVAAGTIWIFLKPVITKLHKRLTSKKAK